MPLTYDDQSRCWRHTQPAEAKTLLEHPALGVRPGDERVPLALQGRAMGWLWERWARMNDGPRHAALREVIDALLTPWGAAQLREATQRVVRDRCHAPLDDAGLDGVLDLVPGCVLAALLGFPEQDLLPIALATRRLVKGTAPQASREDLDAGDEAARWLMDRVTCALHPEHDDELASVLAILWQASDSMAALLGASLVSATCPGAAPAGPPIALTRRHTRAASELLGVSLPAGATVLVDLDASTAFGAGPHRCPGQHLATVIAATATPLILAARARWPSVTPPLRPSHNARIPHFSRRGAP